MEAVGKPHPSLTLNLTVFDFERPGTRESFSKPVVHALASYLAFPRLRFLSLQGYTFTVSMMLSLQPKVFGTAGDVTRLKDWAVSVVRHGVKTRDDTIQVNTALSSLHDHMSVTWMSHDLFLCSYHYLTTTLATIFPTPLV